ncbi:bifunctional DNA-formamidopyrimidine glycosylase/DNA-(apurinic or apyrimidinic site) lyase [Candidatus Pelagibacter sp.]|nr:bifunctional DNA-formamidopyrimidine glycosylase/DNA-(apurinic or apyrimidinic site) lyase [Candidatus Pelagibacter sp.]
MPELPEVEIVRQSLDKKIKQKRVKKVIIRNRNLRYLLPNNFKSYIKNKKIIKVERFSKYLIIHFLEGDYCLVHLGMSGTIHIVDKFNLSKFTNTSFYHSPILPKKHNHIELEFDKFKVIYNDPRRFGFFQLIENSSALKKRFKHLGPEPFDKKFNLNYLLSFFKDKNKDIKSFLLDQRFVSGIGNIYACEILFSSKIDPFKQAKLLTKNECKKIILNSKKILNKAIIKGGSSIRNFHDTSGALGGYQNEFKVYQQDGNGCKAIGCLGIIKKKIISNRSTFFCDSCQN